MELTICLLIGASMYALMLAWLFVTQVDMDPNDDKSSDTDDYNNWPPMMF